MRTFITIIFSGIFASALVALCFYIQEYQSEKETLLKQVLRINRNLCKYYNKLPYLSFDADNDFCKSVRGYYREYYGNQKSEKTNNEIEEIIKKVPKREREEFRKATDELRQPINNEYKDKLLELFQKKPKLLLTQDEKFSVPPEAKLHDIILELDFKIEKSMELYQKIRNEDLRELEELVDSIAVFKKYGVRKSNSIREFINGKDIIPSFYLNRAKDLQNIIKDKDSINAKREHFQEYIWKNQRSNIGIMERIFTIHKRAQTLIDKTFECNRLDEEGNYNKEDVLETLYDLQKTFLGADKGRIGDKDIVYSYKKFIYYMSNLNDIILFELTDIPAYMPKISFAMSVDKYELGQHIFSQSFRGEDINPNIYRF